MVGQEDDSTDQSETNLGWDATPGVGANTGGEGGRNICGGSVCGTFGREGGAFGTTAEVGGAEKAMGRDGFSTRSPEAANLIGDVWVRMPT